MTLNHLILEFIVVCISSYAVGIWDTKPYPWKKSPDGTTPNTWKLESGPLGKHIYLTSHGMYIQNAHQI